MTADILLQEINDMPDELITEYAHYQAKPRPGAMLKWVAAVAACLALLIGIAFRPAQTTDPHVSGEEYRFADFEELRGILPAGHLLESLPVDGYTYEQPCGFFKLEGTDSQVLEDYRYLDFNACREGNVVSIWCTFDYWYTTEYYVDVWWTGSPEENTDIMAIGAHTVYLNWSEDSGDTGMYYYYAIFGDGEDLYKVMDYSADPQFLMDFLTAWLG